MDISSHSIEIVPRSEIARLWGWFNFSRCCQLPKVIVSEYTNLLEFQLLHFLANTWHCQPCSFNHCVGSIPVSQWGFFLFVCLFYSPGLLFSLHPSCHEFIGNGLQQFRLLSIGSHEVCFFGWSRLELQLNPSTFLFGFLLFLLFFNKFIYLLFIYLFIYLFMAVLGLRFCARVFSSCGKRGPLFIAVHGPLTVAASPVAEHRLQMRRLSSCGSRA